MMLSKDKYSNSCSLCGTLFPVFGSKKRICSFCYKFVCSKCSMKKTDDRDYNIIKWICDNKVEGCPVIACNNKISKKTLKNKMLFCLFWCLTY